jgi:hypothetical protein
MDETDNLMIAELEQENMLMRARNARLEAEAAQRKRTWVGLTWNDVPDEWVGKVAFMEGAKWADKQLKEKNT